jgi:hypothetical protein
MKASARDLWTWGWCSPEAGLEAGSGHRTVETTQLDNVRRFTHECEAPSRT